MMYTRRAWHSRHKKARKKGPLPFAEVQKISHILRKKEKEEFKDFESGYDDLVEQAFEEEDTEKPEDTKK